VTTLHDCVGNVVIPTFFGKKRPRWWQKPKMVMLTSRNF
jgi:hypothetical protein